MHYLKAAGLALVAAIAISSMFAATASAKYDSEKEVTELVGTSETVLVFTSKFGKVACQHTELTGAVKGVDVGSAVYTANHITLHPTFKECKAVGFNATVDTDGCDLTFTPPTATDTTGPHAQVDLVPTTGDSCSINVVAVAGLCSIDFPNQTEMGLVDFMNEGSQVTRDVTIEMTTSSIDYEGVGGFCSGKGSDGRYEGAVTLKGSSAGNQVGIWVTNT